MDWMDGMNDMDRSMLLCRRVLFQVIVKVTWKKPCCLPDAPAACVENILVRNWVFRHLFPALTGSMGLPGVLFTSSKRPFIDETFNWAISPERISKPIASSR